jgi:hypothetical protein
MADRPEYRHVVYNERYMMLRPLIVAEIHVYDGFLGRNVWAFGAAMPIEQINFPQED